MSTLTLAMMAPASRTGIRAKLKAKPTTRLSTLSANAVIARRARLRRGRGSTSQRLLVLARLPERIEAGEDEQHRAHVASHVPETTGHALPEQEADDRHSHFEDAKSNGRREARARVDSAQADANGRGKIAQAKRETH
jgi:hypothetical protein